MLQTFIDFWNRLAVKNGKLKFANRREAYEFLRRTQKVSGGPNAKILEMRREYEAIQQAKSKPSSPRFEAGRAEAV